jgi:hypothetical protein
VPERDDIMPIAPGLPTLRGELGLLVNDGSAALVLHATYRPPAGPLGALADALGLSLVARRTASRFLETVAAGLAVPAEGPDARRTNVPPRVGRSA